MRKPLTQKTRNPAAFKGIAGSLHVQQQQGGRYWVLGKPFKTKVTIMNLIH